MVQRAHLAGPQLPPGSEESPLDTEPSPGASPLRAPFSAITKTSPLKAPQKPSSDLSRPSGAVPEARLNSPESSLRQAASPPKFHDPPQASSGTGPGLVDLPKRPSSWSVRGSGDADAGGGRVGDGGGVGSGPPSHDVLHQLEPRQPGKPLGATSASGGLPPRQPPSADLQVWSSTCSFCAK